MATEFVCQSCGTKHHRRAEKCSDCLIKEFVCGLQKHNLNEITEHSHRDLITSLIKQVKNDNDITILNEPKRDKIGRGAPDFLIKKNGVILGYIENKKLEANLSDKDTEKQIQKYSGLSNNILFFAFKKQGY